MIQLFVQILLDNLAVDIHFAVVTVVDNDKDRAIIYKQIEQIAF